MSLKSGISEYSVVDLLYELERAIWEDYAMQKEDELLDVQEVAALLHVNPRTVLRMADRKELTALKVGKRWRFRLRDLDNYLRTQLHAASLPQNTRYDALLNSEIEKRTYDETHTHNGTLREAGLDHWGQESEFDSGLEEPEAQKTQPVLTLKEQTRQIELQGAELQKQETLLLMQKRQLELEKERLELQKDQLELHTRRIDKALETVQRVSMLPPDIDAKTKATLLETLLPELLQPGTQPPEPPTTTKSS